MTSTSAAYSDRIITFATMHGKETLAQEPFWRMLGARVMAPCNFDTDQFGSFDGAFPRDLGVRATARAKARHGMKLAGTSVALASEGSFSPLWGPLVEHGEVLVFIDENRNIELVESSSTLSPLPGARAVRSVDEVSRYATSLGFPGQGLMIHAHRPNGVEVYKDPLGLEQLFALVERLCAEGDDTRVTVMPDYRAHRSPTRATIIGSLATQMAGRLRAPCPACATPGFGHTAVERGLPCGGCGSPTSEIAAHVHGCARCDYIERHARAQRSASASVCDHCNP